MPDDIVMRHATPHFSHVFAGGYAHHFLRKVRGTKIVYDFDVALHVVDGGGHVWPGMLTYIDFEVLAELSEDRERLDNDLSTAEIGGHLSDSIIATEMILDFFDTHP